MKASSSLPVHNLSTGLNYITIQGAINANETKDSQTILVESGTYRENVVINKTLLLFGEDKRTTIIDGNGTGSYAVWIQSSNVQISGFTITNGQICDLEIAMPNVRNLEGILAKDNLICNSSVGIDLTFSWNSRIEGNILQFQQYYGISLASSNNNLIIDNTITNNHEGILCTGAIGIPEDLPPPSQNNTIFHNNFIQNTIQAQADGNKRARYDIEKALAKLKEEYEKREERET